MDIMTVVPAGGEYRQSQGYKEAIANYTLTDADVALLSICTGDGCNANVPSAAPGMLVAAGVRWAVAATAALILAQQVLD
jgi:hypothetical protein